MTATDLSQFPAFDAKSKTLNIFIEAPRGRRTKFKYNEENGLFQFDKVLPPGLIFPFDFGFLPSTLGGDGDPLDVVVLTDEPTFVGCLISGRLLGVIEAEQTEKGKTERNDRLIAIPLSVKSQEPQGTVTEMTDKVAGDVRDFFICYNDIQGKQFKPVKTAGPAEAMRIVEEGIARFKNKHEKSK